MRTYIPWPVLTRVIDRMVIFAVHWEFWHCQHVLGAMSPLTHFFYQLNALGSKQYKWLDVFHSTLGRNFRGQCGLNSWDGNSPRLVTVQLKLALISLMKQRTLWH